MNTAKIIGLETEYAALAEGIGRSDPAILFEGWEPPYKASWDDQPERPWRDARGFVPAASSPSMIEPSLELVADLREIQNSPSQVVEKPLQEIPVHVRWEEPPCVMLPNGARFYLDHTHPEWCTPECATPLEVVAYDKAGEVWLNDLVALINSSREDKEQLTVYKNNVDAYGNTYGCHENYLVDAGTYRSLFDQHAHRLYTALIPFLVTRQVLCGAGKVASLADGEIGFHISQRADFFESILGLQTTHNRPIINTRDEPHADPLRFRRLHVIVGDSNLSEYSTYLKLGTTALILEMLADGCLRLDLTLADPLRAIGVVSQDPKCKETIELEAGNRHYTAVDVQRCFVEAAARYLDEHGDNTYRREVWQTWFEAVQGLAEDPAKLATKVDWAIKYEFFRVQMGKRGWTWATPQVRELDFKYHRIDPERSLFYLLQNKGLVERLLVVDELRQARRQPPQATRARLRTACLDRYHDQVIAVNWDTVVFRGKEERVLRWRWGDPSYGGGEEMGQLLQEAGGLEEFARSMLAIKH